MTNAHAQTLYVEGKPLTVYVTARNPLLWEYLDGSGEEDSDQQQNAPESGFSRHLLQHRKR
jgi:hypothetical protein